MEEQLAGRMFLAEMSGDEREWRRLAAALPEGGDDWQEFLPIALAGLAHRRFDDRDLRLVTRFAQRLVEYESRLDDISPLVVEAVLRGVMGEEPLLDSVDREALWPVMHVTLVGLVDELELDDAQINEMPRKVAQHIDTVYHVVGGRPAQMSPAAQTIQFLRRRNRRYLTDEELRQASSKRRAGQRDRRWRRARLSTVAGRYALALLLRDGTERRRLETVLDSVGPRDIPAMIRALFATMVPKQFDAVEDLRQIGAFVVSVRDGIYPELDLMKTEHLIRAALGEELPSLDLTGSEGIGIRVFVVTALADWWDRDRARITDAIAEAEELVATSGHVLAAEEV